MLHASRATFPLILTTTLWWSILQLGSVSDLQNLPKVTELFPRTNRIEELLNHLAVSLPIQAPKGTTSVCEWGLSNHEHLLFSYSQGGHSLIHCMS